MNQIKKLKRNSNARASRLLEENFVRIWRDYIHDGNLTRVDILAIYFGYMDSDLIVKLIIDNLRQPHTLDDPDIVSEIASNPNKIAMDFVHDYICTERRRGKISLSHVFHSLGANPKIFVIGES